MHVNICGGLGVIAAKNGFIIVIDEVLHGPFPYSMKERILSVFDSSGKEVKP